ncbi:MAG TPA: TetR/AcrR family transcriptional regulator [Sphingobacterium sp.]|nr:TetR/AcrR family transcriptional regulator [Sphingobacterium sp.]
MDNNNTPSDAKRQAILEAATRRFAHFGMAKTTMNEIAKDISASKALLYYYFPNKHTLYASVMEYVIDNMAREVEEILKDLESSEEAMDAALEKRVEIINEYYNLFEYTYVLRKDVPEDMKTILKNTFAKELSQVAKILEIGVNNQEYALENVENTARLLLYALMGVRIAVLKDMSNPIFPSKEDFKKILSHQKELARIFIQGLKA